jgi:hypothetical protein
MRASPPCRGLVLAGLLTLVATPSSVAQLCPDPSNDTFWKVDTLPDTPVGVPLTSQVIVALCEGEAVGSFFQLAPGSNAQYIKSASIGLGHTGGQTDHQFSLSVEIYEGSVGFNPGGAVSMGTKVFDLVADEGMTFTGSSNGMNTFDLQPFNIVVEDDFVVAFRIRNNISFPGCPGAVPGVPANPLTDGSGLCSPGKSLLDERNTGWVDPADWQFTFGQPICPTFYSGNWAVRACTADAGFWDDLGGGTSGINGLVTCTGSGPLTVGTFNPITVTNAAPNALMITWIALTPGPPIQALGGTVHTFPFGSQLLFFSNASGGFSAAASWPPGIPPGTEAYFQFFVDDPSVIWGLTLSNAVRGTTP